MIHLKTRGEARFLASVAGHKQLLLIKNLVNVCEALGESERITRQRRGYLSTFLLEFFTFEENSIFIKKLDGEKKLILLLNLWLHRKKAANSTAELSIVYLCFYPRYFM